MRGPEQVWSLMAYEKYFIDTCSIVNICGVDITWKKKKAKFFGFRFWYSRHKQFLGRKTSQDLRYSVKLVHTPADDIGFS